LTVEKLMQVKIIIVVDAKIITMNIKKLYGQTYIGVMEIRGYRFYG
tara:strand:+ start:222 stop:359 length:138 start_codon:yes stop_codon:yes gene_type:complete